MVDEICPKCKSFDVDEDQCEVCDGFGDTGYDDDKDLPIECWRCKGNCTVSERNYCHYCGHVWYIKEK